VLAARPKDRLSPAWSNPGDSQQLERVSQVEIQRCIPQGNLSVGPLGVYIKREATGLPERHVLEVKPIIAKEVRSFV